MPKVPAPNNRKNMISPDYIPGQRNMGAVNMLSNRNTPGTNDANRL